MVEEYNLGRGGLSASSCLAAPHCTKVVVNVTDDVCEEGENNSAHGLATPRKLDNGRRVARMQAKLVMAAQNGNLRDWTKAALSPCLDGLGVKVPSGSNRQTRNLAM